MSKVKTKPKNRVSEKKPEAQATNGKAHAKNEPQPAKELSPMEQLQRERDELAAQVDRLNRHRKRGRGLVEELNAIDGEIHELSEELKELKAAREKKVSQLRSHESSDPRQDELPFKEGDAASAEPAKQESAPAPVHGRTVPITALNLSDALTEKLAGAGIDTVHDLEEAFAKKGLNIKGVGTEKINTISDALRKWREKNPGPREAEPAELVDGQWDKAAYHAGAIAHADGLPLDKNPYDPFRQTLQHESWKAGWASKVPTTAGPAQNVDLGLPAPAKASLWVDQKDGKWGFAIHVTDGAGITLDQPHNQVKYVNATRDESLIQGATRVVNWFSQRCPDLELRAEVIRRCSAFCKPLGPQVTNYDRLVEFITYIEELTENGHPKQEPLLEILGQAETLLNGLEGDFSESQVQQLAGWQDKVALIVESPV